MTEELAVEEIKEAILDLLVLVQERGWEEEEMDSYLVPDPIRDREGYCPLAALYHEITGERPDWGCDAFLLVKGMPQKFYDASELVAEAADNATDPLRPRLLQVLGMAPE